MYEEKQDVMCYLLKIKSLPHIRHVRLLYPLIFHITKTSPYYEHPLTPHFYIVNLGFTGVYFFLIFAPKHRLWVPTINVLSKNKKT